MAGGGWHLLALRCDPFLTDTAEVRGGITSTPKVSNQNSLTTHTHKTGKTGNSYGKKGSRSFTFYILHVGVETVL